MASAGPRGNWRLIQSHNCNVNIYNSATFTKFPGLQDSLTGLLSSVQQQAIQNQVRQLGPDPAGFPKLRQFFCTEEFSELTMTLTIVLKWDSDKTGQHIDIDQLVAKVLENA